MRSRRVFLPLALIASLVPIAAACGGRDGLPADPVAAAALKTEATGSFRLDYTAVISTPRAPLKRVRVGGTGVFDSATGAGRMTFEAEMPAELERELGGALDGEVIVDTADKLVVYMRFAFLSKVLPPGKPWLKLDAQTLGEEQGIDVQMLMQTSQSDPTGMLHAVAESNAKPIGNGRVRGVPTTRYRLDFDIADLLARLLGEQPGFKRMIDALGLDTTPAEAWVDEQGLVRRLKLTWTQKDPASGERISTAMTEELYDFGVDVVVKPPPARLVVDAAMPHL